MIGHSKTTPRIYLCMIVKNEKNYLSRCFNSGKNFVDEMIIVDTGSTDRTPEIAESYCARVYHHPSENNFSRHRTQSFSYSGADWILQLDADEKLFIEAGFDAYIAKPIPRQELFGKIEQLTQPLTALV